MMLISITETFAAAHHLPNHPKCGEKHGHNYKVEVTVQIDSNDKDYTEPIVVDFADLKNAVNNVLAIFDHSDLNEKFEIPTAENLCKYIAKFVSGNLSNKRCVLYSVKVWETDKYYAMWKRD